MLTLTSQIENPQLGDAQYIPYTEGVLGLKTITAGISSAVINI
jgi:hypothetical protein